MPNGTSHCTGQWSVAVSNIDFQCHQISRFQIPKSKRRGSENYHATSCEQVGGPSTPILSAQIIALRFFCRRSILFCERCSILFCELCGEEVHMRGAHDEAH